MRFQSLFVLAAAAAPLLTFAAPARAQFNAEQTRLGVRADIWPFKSGSENVVVSAMSVGGQVSILKRVVLEGDLPWVVAAGGGETHASFGNITLGGKLVGRVTPFVALNGGATVSIPTRFSADRAEDVVIPALGAASSAYYEAHRWMPMTTFVRIPLGAEVKLSILRLRGEVVPTVWIPVGDNTGKPQFMLNVAGEGELRAPFGLMGGLRLQAAFGVTDGLQFSPGDRAQTAIEPFIGYEPSRLGLYVRLGLLTALDSPAGFGFEQGKVMTVRTQLGLAF